MRKEIAFKFHHATMDQSYITLCTQYDREENLLYVGYAIFNSKDGHFVKKIGNLFAKERCLNTPLIVKVNPYHFPVSHFQLTWMATSIINEDMHCDKPLYGIRFPDFTKEFINHLEKIYHNKYLYYIKSKFADMIDEYLFYTTEEIKAAYYLINPNI